MPAPPRRPRLPALDPDDYARGHAAFEARSDQRGLIVDWLAGRLARRRDAAALSVLSVGCGTGAVEAALVADVSRDAAPGARRRWTGLDPHAPSVAAYVAGLGGQAPPGTEVTGLVGAFEDVEPAGPFDVVLLVHCLYYVPDLAAALRRSLGLLAPGGEVLVLHAPRGALNEVADALAPLVAGHAQPWSADVAEALAGLDAHVETVDLDGVVDLTGCGSADPALLDFTVQGVLDDDTRREVLALLAAAALQGPGLRLPHPVSAFAVVPTEGPRPLRSRP